MSIVQLVQSLEKYSIDILSLGFLVCALTSIVKRFFSDKLKKYITFLPFILGIAVYIGYIYIATKNIALTNIRVYENGIKCGLMATIYYVLYEQFIRGKTKYPVTSNIKEIAIAGQLDSIVLSNHLSSVSKKIFACIVDHKNDRQHCEEFIFSQIKGKEKPAITDNDIHAVASLIMSSIMMMPS